jgi:AraC-like DNA-binding protein
VLSTATPHDWAPVEIAVPDPSCRLPGISMAGFRQREPALVDLAMVAHPSVTLLLDLSEADTLGYDGQAGCERGSVIIGLMPGDLRVTGSGIGDCLQIRLEPALAAAAFGATTEITGSVVPLDAVWGPDATRATQRLRAAPSWRQRFAIAAEILARRLDTRPAVDPEVAHTWRLTLATRGRLRVEGLADHVGWSRKRLWSRFRSQLGITPKRAAQLVRFDHAAHLLASGRAPATVAAETGYVDQSHLHREVKAFAGLTPTGLAAAPWLVIDDIAWPQTTTG